MLITIREALSQARALLVSCNIDEACLEAELLLMDVLGIRRAELYTELDSPLSPKAVEEFWQLVKRRSCYEPTAYILKQYQFYGRNFYIDNRAFIPRPETELLVEEALEFARKRSPYSIADVGTGSGVIAISLSINLPWAKVYAIDISSAALEVAAMNCQRYKVKVHLLCGDLLQPLPEAVDIIVANLPYISKPEFKQLSPEIINFEPISALNGGANGLEIIHRLLPQAKEKLRPGGLILFEIGQGQGEEALALASHHFPDARIDLLPDLRGIDRVVRVLRG